MKRKDLSEVRIEFMSRAKAGKIRISIKRINEF